MDSNNWNDNMDELYELSQNLEGIKFTRRIHPGLVMDAQTAKNHDEIQGDPLKLYDWMMKEFGHCVLGKYQFLYEKGDQVVSCIRSGASFGYYELYGGNIECERYSTAEEALTRIKESLK